MSETLDDFFEGLKGIKETVKPKDSKPKKRETTSNVYHEDLPDIDDGCCPVCGKKLSEITYAVVNLEYASQTTLEKKVEGIFSSEHLSIKPNGNGGYWGCGRKFLVTDENGDGEGRTEFLQYLMEWRSSLFRKPYTENLENGRRFSNLKAEHVFINVSEGTREWIERHIDRSWEDFLKEWNQIDAMPIPDGYVELVSREVGLEKELKDVEERICHFNRGFDGFSYKDRYDLENPFDIEKAIEALKELREVLPVKIRIEHQLEDVKEEIKEMVEGE